MRIGLSAAGATVDEVVRQAEQAESDGFTSLWYACPLLGDPLAAMVLAGRGHLTSSAVWSKSAGSSSEVVGRPISWPPLLAPLVSSKHVSGRPPIQAVLRHA